MKKSILVLVVLVAAVALFSGCADVEVVEECVIGKTYGFLSGLWHGIVSPFAWLGSLFSDNIAIYAVNNNGGWYDFGFILGIGGLSGGTTSTVKSRR